MSMLEKDLLQKLINFPSVNPDFDQSSHEPRGEAPLTDYLQSFLEEQGWPWLRQYVHSGRDNLIALLSPKGSAPPSEVILFEVHQDTVGVAGMTIEPFAATESQGRIWGRGACDVKGGMAAMLAALAKSQSERTEQSPAILIAFTVNEENGFTGAKQLCNLWRTPDPEGITGTLDVEILRSFVPTKVIVAEPTELDVVVAHKGSLRWRCHTHGRAAHTSQPELGINAIATMASVVNCIEEYQQALCERKQHPLCGKPSVCVSTFAGGSGVNTVPDHAVIDIDYRIVPGELPESCYQDLIDWIAKTLPNNPARIEHERPFSQCPGLDDSMNRHWGEEISNTVKAIGQPSQLIGVPYGTNAWVYAQQGWPTVIFGPGSIAQAHTSDEWISVDQLMLATKVFQKIACGGIQQR